MISLLTICLLILTALCLWTLASLYEKKRWMILLVAVPLMLIAASSTIYTIQLVMGAPTEVVPQKFLFLSYLTDGKMIYMWFLDPDTHEPRTVKFPYSTSLHKQMEEAKQQTKSGQAVQGRAKAPDPKGLKGAEENKAKFEFYNFTQKPSLPSKEASE